MGLPITGAFARRYQEPRSYAGAAVWGTGVNPVHAIYGGPGRPFGPGVPNDLDNRTVPAMATDDQIEYGPPWGAPEDAAYLDSVADEDQATHGVPFYQDDFPDWGETTPETRGEIPEGMAESWGDRAIPSGLHHLGGEGPDPRPPETSGRQSAFPQVPTETVNEGWLNKETGGSPPDAEPSDNTQIFVQTSMTQRYKKLDNDRAQMRQTDDPRTDIDSRVQSNIVKVYSGEDRHYDMFPRQLDDIPRPFYYRTAGTGPHPYLAPNAMRLVTPMQRTPPPDASGGIPDTQIYSDKYGYTSEDQGYY